MHTSHRALTHPKPFPGVANLAGDILQGCAKLHHPKNHQAPTLLKGCSGGCVLGIPLYLSKHI